MMSHRVNYLYFGAFFGLLILLCASSIFTKQSLGGAHLFFFFYALGQIVIEIFLIITLTHLLRKYVGQIASALFIGGTFFALFLHIFDFLMDRILDLSVWEALNVFVLQESFHHFFFLLDASGISLWVWFLFFGLLALLPILGMALYQITDKIAAKRPMSISYGHVLQAFICLPAALLLWDFSASSVIHPDSYTAFRKSLPWKFTFLQPQNALLSLPGSLKSLEQEEAISQQIENNQTVLTKRPNIYLFITESLRADSITPEIAPHLFQFKNDFVQFPKALAGGNGTHISWFTIFHSQLPFHWKLCQKNWTKGSPALRLLKKWGYKVRLYSSAQLSYYGMEKLLFGEKSDLLDSRQMFHHVPPESAADTDAAALAKLQEDLATNPNLKEGHVFIIFWDTTHFNYAWPKKWSPKFQPYAKEFAYFRTFQSKKRIQAIKNRYFNAVNYMDSLFGKFMEKIQDDAIVVFTGDHGEEFFDHGHLFHNSHLTEEQTHIPLYFKFGDGALKTKGRSVMSQMDIFPSIIDYLGAKVPSFLEGNSLFQKPAFPYAITARFNAGNAPYEFSIHNGQNKLIVQFFNQKEIYNSKKLKIISLKNNEEKTVHVEDVNSWIHEKFGVAIDHLFSSDR